MKDWLGNEFGPGDKVIYAAGSGRSITMIVAEVVEVYDTFRNDNYKMIKLKPGQLPPFKQVYDRVLDEYVNTAEREQTYRRVKVKPIKSSRWAQHSGRTRYTDTRTGDGIDPFRIDRTTGLYMHMDGGYYERISTGQKVHQDHTEREPVLRSVLHWDDSTVPDGWRHVKDSFKYYVQEEKQEVRAVTLVITNNITKWTGEVPE